MKSTRSAENKIKTARLAAGMTQAEMSEKYGIPADTIKSWDRGKAYPSLWVEALLLDRLREESLIRKKLVSMYGNLDQFPTYDVVTANGADVKSVTIIGNDKCTDENGFFLYALADDEKLYKAYYNAADHDLSKPLIMIDITGDFIKRKKPHDSAELEEYCKGIIYSTGYLVNGEEKSYVTVRNLDPWYANIVAEWNGKVNVYQSKYNLERDGAEQWAVKLFNLPRFPELDDIKNFSAFARAYIEIHGVLDSHIIKGYQNRRTRLRIYGNLDVLSLLNDVLPAKPKKIQEINTQTGTTYCLCYQSKTEVCEILDWIDGFPRNESVWEHWNKTLDCK